MIPISQGLSGIQYHCYPISNSSMILGNIGCIYASRVSTALQMKNQQYKEIKWITIATLFFINFIFQIGFLIFIHQAKILSINLTFIFVYQTITGIVVSFKPLGNVDINNWHKKVMISLFLGELLTHLCWKYDLDPDIHSFPLLSSVTLTHCPG